MSASPDPPKVGLVLGAGGITGIAWLAGAVRALHERTGWDPATADLITGTSAGGVVAAVVAAGDDPCDLLVHAEQPEVHEEAVRRATAGRGRDGIGLPWPGSLRLAASGLAATSPRRRLLSLTGLLPRGMRSSDEIRGLTHEAAVRGWPADTELWLHAWDMEDARLVTFGRAGAPDASLADAVVASCAVPGYYRPATIAGRTYIDAGPRSLTNADLLAGEGCDTVFVLSPFSSRKRGALLDTAILGAARSATASRTAREVERLRVSGSRVVVVHPTAADLRALGPNPMDRARSRRVLESAVASVGDELDGALDGIDLPAPPARAGHRAA